MTARAGRKGKERVSEGKGRVGREKEIVGVYSKAGAQEAK